MSSAERRWVEVSFYYFSLDIYHINNDIMDVASIIELIATMTKGAKIERLKALSAKLIADINSMPSIQEVVFLMHDQGYSATEIGKTINKTKRQVNRYLSENECPYFRPILKESDDKQIQNFLITAKKVKEAGI